MTQSEDLDMMLDGYDPEQSLQRPVQPEKPKRRKRRPRAVDSADEPLVPSTPDNNPTSNQQQTSEPNAFVKFFTDERLRVFLGGFLSILSIFVIIAFISYMRLGALDQSEVVNSSAKEIVESGAKVNNWAGAFGLWLSHALLSHAFGLGSLVLVVYFWVLALALLGIKKCSFWSATFKCLLLMITISVVLGLFSYNQSSLFYLGGNHGHYINQLLFEYTGWPGAVLVSALLVFAVVSVYIADLKRWWNKWREISERRRLQEQLELENKRQLEDIEDSDEEDVESDDDDDEEDENTESTTITLYDDDELPADDKSDTENEPAEDSDNDEDAADGTAPSEDGGEEDFSVVAPEIELADGQAPTHIGVDEPYDHRAELSRYRMPDIELLTDRPSGPVINMDEQEANKERIVRTLLDYKIPISRIEATVGPTVTLYEIVPAEGVRIAQIKRLEDDIALSLSALGIRIIAPIPGKGTIGIEVPNSDPQTVSMRSVIASKKFAECQMALPMAMGATISNDIFIADLAKMPHMLVAGATGQGKSVGLNAIIASLLYKKHPSELKFVLIDPKMVEFSLYAKLERHYLAKLPDEEDAIITDMQKVIQTLNSLCVEMDDRYKLLRNAGVRSLEEYNKKFAQRKLNPENGHKYLPYIVVIVDEFADLIMTAGKEVETPIARIAQKARAVGIHMIIATQRPSTNVITGLIKANFPGRIAFRVSQMVDSKTILDRSGAQRLIGRGDMLFSHNGSLERVQCAFMSTEEVETLAEFVDNQVGYEHAYYLPEYVPETSEGGGAMAGASMERDALFDEAARFVVTRNQGSTSSLQRQFGIGYNRAGKLMDQMEAAGIVGPVNGQKPRNILVDIITLESILGN